MATARKARLGVGGTDWLEALSAGRASPGAGSASAVVGAIGVALLIKLARLSSPQVVADHSGLLDRLQGARDRLVALSDADASAVSAWLSARRLNPGHSARQAALRALVEVPLAAAEVCRQVSTEAQPLLHSGHQSALADGEVGLRLVETCQKALCALIRGWLPPPVGW